LYAESGTNTSIFVLEPNSGTYLLPVAYPPASLSLSSTVCLSVFYEL
jgi:hypothetical protein